MDETPRRAEWRALRLFLYSPVCRDPLACLVIRTALYRSAQDCLVHVHTRTRQAINSVSNGTCVRAVLSLCPQLDPELAHLLQQLCSLDPELQDALFARLEEEMMAILDVLVGGGEDLEIWTNPPDEYPKISNQDRNQRCKTHL